MPLISVILPVYNTEKYIAEAVQSILEQTFNDFELLVINDASTDSTLQILETFTDPRLKIITNAANLKVVRSLNKGLDLAQGEFIARMDADDLSLPGRFQKQVEYLNEHQEVDVCGTWVHAFGADDFIFSPYEKHDDIKANFIFLNTIIHPSVMFRKSSFIKNGLVYDDSYINAEDYGLWADGIDKLIFANIPEILIKYRLHENNRSGLQNQIPQDLREMNFKAYRNIFQKSEIKFQEKHLEMNLELALRMIGNLSTAKFNEYIEWLKMIASTNKTTRYYDHKALRNVILHELIYLIKKVGKTPSAFVAATKAITTMYSIKDYAEFIQYRSRKLAKASKQLSIMNSVHV